MRHWLIFNDEILTLAAGELGSAGLLSIKMVKAGLTGNYFSIFRDL